MQASIWKKFEFRKASSKDYVFEFCPVIDADFVEINEDSFSNQNASSESNSEPIDSELLEKLRKYLEKSSQEEVSEIFEKIHKFWKAELLKADSKRPLKKKFLLIKRRKIKDITRNAFRPFLGTASCGKKRIIGTPRVASSKPHR